MKQRSLTQMIDPLAETGKRTGERKNGVGLFRYPRRRDIAPTGELAGLSARDSPKPYLLRTPSYGFEEVIPSCQN
jgi:hypothetical protein